MTVFMERGWTGPGVFWIRCPTSIYLHLPLRSFLRLLETDHGLWCGGMTRCVRTFTVDRSTSMEPWEVPNSPSPSIVKMTNVR